MKRHLRAFFAAGAFLSAGLSLGAATVIAPGMARAQEGVEGTGSMANEGHDVEKSIPTECPTTPGDAAEEQCMEYWEHHINWFSWDYKEGPNQAPEHRHMPAPFGFALLNFVVFAMVMYKLAAQPLADFVRTRHTTVKRDLDEAAVLHREAEAKLKEYETKIAGLDREIEALLSSVRTEAEHEKARIVAEAERQAERMKEEARSQIANELARVRQELKAEVVDRALVAAEELLTGKTGVEDQARLAERFVKSIETPAPSVTPTAAAVGRA